MKTTKAILCALSLFAFGCAGGRAAGTRPTDMTATEHRAACAKHKAEAETARGKAEALDGDKGTYTAESTATSEERASRQHGEAAMVVDPSGQPCE